MGNVTNLFAPFILLHSRGSMQCCNLVVHDVLDVHLHDCVCMIIILPPQTWFSLFVHAMGNMSSLIAPLVSVLHYKWLPTTCIYRGILVYLYIHCLSPILLHGRWTLMQSELHQNLMLVLSTRGILNGPYTIIYSTCTERGDIKFYNRVILSVPFL